MDKSNPKRYREISLYQRAYQLTIDLHLELNKFEKQFDPMDSDDLRSISRDILIKLAEWISSDYKRGYDDAKTSVGRMIVNIRRFIWKHGVGRNFKDILDEYLVVQEKLGNREPIGGIVHPRLLTKRP